MAFDVEVRDDERAGDVFMHPFAYAACHGIEVPVSARSTEPELESESEPITNLHGWGHSYD